MSKLICKRRCYRRDPAGNCLAYTIPYGPGEKCPSQCNNPHQLKKECQDIISKNQPNNPIVKECLYLIEKMDLIIGVEINKAYEEDKNRGSGGGSKNCKPNTAALKQKMKDNRPIECKQTKEENKEYQEELKHWQEDHNEKLEVHKSVGYGMNRGKVDSYTGTELDTKGNPVYSPEEIQIAANNLLQEGRIDMDMYEKILTGEVKL